MRAIFEQRAPATRLATALRWVLAALLVMALTAGLIGALRAIQPRSRAVGQRSASPQRLSSLPIAAQGPVSAALGADDPSFRMHVGRAGVRAVNRAQGLRAWFDRSGVAVRTGSLRLALGLSAVGYGGRLRPVREVEPRAYANRVVYRRGTVTDWYANGPLGLEQGFSLPRAPVDAGSGPLTLALRVGGDLHPVVADGGSRLVFEARGRAILSYGGLVASDAYGRLLRTRMSIRRGFVLLSVDARQARYPVRIDPLLQTEEASVSQDVVAVAVSGSTIVVGEPDAPAYSPVTDARESEAGAVYVITEPSSGWQNATQAAELTASDAHPADWLGASVAIEGSTIVAGAPGHTQPDNKSGVGAVYVFTEPASGWQSEIESGELAGRGTPSGGESAGSSVAISGSTIVTGGPYGVTTSSSTAPAGDRRGGGSVLVFTKPAPGEGITRPLAVLTGPPGVDLGVGVAISGSTIAAIDGASVDVFAEPATGWPRHATPTAELIPSDGVDATRLGPDGLWAAPSLAMQGGTIAVVGQKAVDVFTEPATGWHNATQNARLPVALGSAGGSVAISGSAIAVAGERSVAISGSTIAAGAGAGGVYAFAEPAGGWQSDIRAVQPTGVKVPGFGSVFTISPPPPVFRQASPPVSVRVGNTLSYTFSATGYPAPRYALAPGAPPWLTINSTSGTVTGSVPAGTPYFSYSVTATTGMQSVTVGPFPTSVAVPVTVSGHVTAAESGRGVARALVEACVEPIGLCLPATTTTAKGAFSVDALPGTTISLTAGAPPNSGLIGGSSGPLRVGSTGLHGLAIVAGGPFRKPSAMAVRLGAAAGGVQPMLYDGSQVLLNAAPYTVPVSGCPNGFAVASVVAPDYPASLVVLGQTAHSGHYSGTLPPQYPINAPAELEAYVSCPPPTSAVFPTVGPSTGGNTVVLSGASLASPTAVLFGGVRARKYRPLRAGGIQVIAPAGTGTVQVAVRGPGAPASGRVVGDYTYQAVRSVAPHKGPAVGGTWVIVTGAGLEGVTHVLFGRTDAEFVSLSDTKLEALSPPGHGRRNLTVQTAYGYETAAVAADQFTYTVAHSAPKRSAHGGHASAPAASRAAAPANGSSTIFAAGPPATSTEPLGRSQVAAPRDAMSLPSRIVPFVEEHATDVYGARSSILEDISNDAASLHPTCATIPGTLTARILNVLRPHGAQIDAWVQAATQQMMKLELSAPALFSKPGWSVTVAGALTRLAVRYVIDQTAEWAVGTVVKAQFARLGCEKPHSPSGPCSSTASLPPSPFASRPPVPPPDRESSGSESPQPCFMPNVLIDPAGTIVDASGKPVSGATATIFGSTKSYGPFMQVKVGRGSDPNIRPAENPEPASGGTFDWAVLGGFYKVQGSARGCSSQTTQSFPASPAKLGLIITISCPNESPPSAPSVQSVSPSTGPPVGGTKVTIVGTGFLPSSTVVFGKAIKATYLSPQMLTVMSPGGAGSVDVQVTTTGGTSAKSANDRFLYR